jgi:hypothetical protein
MKIQTTLGFAAAVLAAPYAAAQEAPATVPAATPATPAATPASSDAVREALAKKAGDADQASQLKETLSAVDKQYSMIKKGTLQLNYELNYAYIGQEKINTDLASGTATLFSIENNNSHTFTNTVMADYGLRNNLTASLAVPFISRYSDTADFSGVSNSIGDIGLSARWQPMAVQRDLPSWTVTGGVRLASGDSPFKTESGKGLAGGSGINTFNAGINVNQIVDPVALFGSLNVNAGLPAKHLNQQLGSAVLRKVKPGVGAGFGVGFAYALSYKITTSFAFQESITAGSTLTFDNGRSAKTSTQTAGILSIGAGYRISPKTTVNLSVGIGLTAAAPNLSMTLGFPLNF